MRSLVFLSCASLILLPACATPKDDGDGDGETVGDGDGDGDTTGDGDGDDDPGDGDGDGDDDPACMGGDVNDEFSVTGLPEATTSQTCTVTAVNVAEPQYDVTLDCDDGNASFEVTLQLAASTAVGVQFPLAVDDEVTLASWYEEFPPFYLSYTVHALDGKLLLAWVENFGLEPAGASPDWSLPVELSEGPGCTPDMNNTSKQSIVATLLGAEPATVYMSHAGVLSSELGIYELRVTRATYNPDIDGGCNSCYAFALVGR